MYPADAGHHGQNPQQAANRPWDSHHHHHPQSGYPYPPPPNGYQQPPPVNGAHPPAPREGQQSAPATAPPSQIRPDRPEMAAIHPQQHYGYPPPPHHGGPYLPAPPNLYPHPQHHDYRGPPQQAPPQQQVQQSAPRQRTAIACKYCRRRKIRCSGFENSEDGRCSNCVRFSQECVFTPVSAQTQAFVPAQALYRRAQGGPPPGAPQQLYGPYGNRLPPQDQHAYPPPPPGSQPGYTLPSPTGAYPPPGHAYAYPPPPQGYPEPPSAGGRRRRDEPHTPTAAPPNPSTDSHMAHRDSYGGPPGYHYPDPQAAHAGSPHAPPPGYAGPPQPYYPGPAPPRRNSPGSTSGYSYDASRTSHSPHGAPPYGYPPTSAPAPPNYGAPPTSGPARTTPPHPTERGRSGMSIQDMVSNDNGAPSSGERSAADSSMVSMLNRPTKR